MSKIIVLDAGPLGQITNPKSPRKIWQHESIILYFIRVGDLSLFVDAQHWRSVS
jgi:hypothetical protein